MTEPEEVVTRGEELARAHTGDELVYALMCRLAADGCHSLAGIVWMRWYHEAEGSVRGAYLAPPLVTRLRLDGREQTADALASLLGGASLEHDPRFRLPDLDEGIAARGHMIADLRAQGWEERRARRFVSGQLVGLHSGLVRRLTVDGRGALAETIEATYRTFEARAGGEAASPDRPRIVDRERSAMEETGIALARTTHADVLACAMMTRLQAEERDVFAGSLMAYWLEEMAGPIIEPRRLADALIARLRAEDRGEVADEIETLVRDAAIDRDPEEILALWHDTVAGPIIHAGPLAAALGVYLRASHLEDLATAVAALLAAP
jgi:hypothetical protein